MRFAQNVIFNFSTRVRKNSKKLDPGGSDLELYIYTYIYIYIYICLYKYVRTYVYSTYTSPDSSGWKNISASSSRHLKDTTHTHQTHQITLHHSIPPFWKQNRGDFSAPDHFVLRIFFSKSYLPPKETHVYTSNAPNHPTSFHPAILEVKWRCLVTLNYSILPN